MKLETGSIGRRWLITMSLFFFLAINFADKALIGLAAEPIMRELHLSHTEFGRIAASFFTFFSIASMAVGLLSNRIQTRWLLFAMAVTWSIAQIPLLLVATPVTLVASRMLLGASEGPAYPVALHSLYKWFPDHERAVPTAVLTVGSAFGVGIVAPAITAVIVAHGWRTAFLVLAVVGLVWSVVWLFVGKEGRIESHGAHGGAAASSEPDALAAKLPLWKLLLCRTYVGANLTGFAAYALLTIQTIWLPSYLVRVDGYSLTQVGWIAVLPAFGLMVASPLLGWWSHRLMARGVSSRHARGTLGSAVVAVSGIALVLMPALPPGPLLVAVLTIAFSVTSFTFVTGGLLAAEVAPVAQRGGVLGINVCITTLAGFVTPAVMGQIIDHAATPIAGYRFGMTLAGVIAIGAAIVGMLLINPAADRRRFAALASRRAQRSMSAPLAAGEQ